MNRKQKRELYEAVMKSVRKSLNESVSSDYEDHLYKYLQTHDELSLCGSFECEDSNGWFEMELESAFLEDSMVYIGYRRIVTYHELHTTDEEYETILFSDLDDDVQQDIIELLEDEEYYDANNIDESVDSVEQYYYIITLQDGTEVYNSLDDDFSYDSYKEAEYECDSKLDDIVDSQSDDEDAFMIGDYRTKIISM